MKTIPKHPYLDNMFKYYWEHIGNPMMSPNYVEWLDTHGFKVPVDDELEFPDDFSDNDIMLFVLRWS